MTNRLLSRLSQGPMICAEGYLFELERRGWVQVGPFVPEVVLEDPSAVKQLHREFVRAGSDVIEAFTYYAHRSKMELINKGHLLEEINRGAIELAHEVRNEFGGEDLLVAGNICNSCDYIEGDDSSAAMVAEMFDEQVRWAKEGNVDFVIGETYDFLGEALIALDTIQRYELPSVITFVCHQDEILRDGYDIVEACKIAEDRGADVVGLNCARGPQTMLPLMERICDKVNVPTAALPVGYRTDASHPTFQSLSSDVSKKYLDIDCHTCTRFDIEDFTREALDMGVKYLGVCCGGAPHHVRSMAETMGKKPISSKYSADLSLHFCFGNDDVTGLHEKNLKFRQQM